MNKLEVFKNMAIADAAGQLIENKDLTQLVDEITYLQDEVKAINFTTLAGYDRTKGQAKALKTKTNKFIKENLKPIKSALKYLKDDFVGEVEKSLTNQIKTLESTIEEYAVMSGLIVTEQAPATPKYEKVACCGECGSENIIYKMKVVE